MPFPKSTPDKHFADKNPNQLNDNQIEYCVFFLSAGKPSQGSGSFGGVLGSRTTQKEANRQFSYIENQVCLIVQNFPLSFYSTPLFLSFSYCML